VLRLLGFFDRTAAPELVMALRKAPSIAELTDHIGPQQEAAIPEGRGTVVSGAAGGGSGRARVSRRPSSGAGLLPGGATEGEAEGVQEGNLRSTSI